jgi:hypothetical protein
VGIALLADLDGWMDGLMLVCNASWISITHNKLTSHLSFAPSSHLLGSTLLGAPTHCSRRDSEDSTIAPRLLSNL